MGHLFLDIETYKSNKNPDSSLCPYYTESRIIVISYSYYPTFKPPQMNEIKKPTFLKEWESSEKDILQHFYQTLKNILKNDKYLKFYGFNITTFDLPYLFGRMKINNIAGETELYNLFFRTFAIDMYYLSTIISNETIKREQLWGLNQKKVSEFFKLKVKEGTGDMLSQFYNKKEFEKIMKYCTEEFNFEQMLNAFYFYIRRNIVNKESI